MSHHFPDIKQVCIFGTGGVGGYFGGRIADAFTDPQFKDYGIYFVARGENLGAIKQHGITIKTPDRIISARPNLATDNIGEIPAPDLILLCVKSYDLNQAVAAIKTTAKDNTVIIPLLNGVDIVGRIRAILDKGIVLPACLYLGTHIESPGVIQQSGGNGIIIFGTDPQNPGYKAEAVKDFFQKTGIKYEWYDDALPKIWEKYIFITSFGLVTALTREPLGTIMKNDRYRGMIKGIIEEIYAISIKQKINLSSDIIGETLDKGYNFPSEARTSYQRDLERGSRFNEGDLFGGTIIREGKVLGVSTPITEAVYLKITKLYGKSM